METTITKVATGVSVATILALSISKWKQNRVPQRWSEVGTISDLYFFPIKSCGKMEVREVECTNIGMKKDFLWDRTLMVIQESSKKFVTVRQHPSLVKVVSSISSGLLRLSAPGMEDIEVNVEKVVTMNNALSSEVYEGVMLQVLDCGDDVAKWFSSYVLKKENGLRLVFYPFNYPTRPVYKRSQNFPEATPEHAGTLHDETSFMMINQSSVDDLNTRLDFITTPLTFRPNLVIKGPKPFDEDRYKWVKIGDETIMKVTQQCLRCAVTVVDPEKGERRKDGQPLKALKEYRKNAKYGESPVMGIHLGLIKGGKVKIGDRVFVQSD